MPTKTRWQVGAEFPAFVILERVSERTTNRDAVFRIRTTCCGIERTVTRSMLNANAKKERCADCRAEAAREAQAKPLRQSAHPGWTNPNKRKTFEPGFRSHVEPGVGITYVRPHGDAHVVRRDCCGAEQIMTHTILTGYLKRAGTGSGKCRTCMATFKRGRRIGERAREYVSANPEAVLSDLESVVLTHQWVDPEWQINDLFGWDHQLRSAVA